GIYPVLIPVSSYVMLRRGLATRARKIFLGMTIFMFALSTTHGIASIATLIRLIQVLFLAADPDAQSGPTFLPLFNALILVNYVLTDGVVIWRAWVLCSVDGTKTLTCCGFSVIATIAIHITLMVIDIKETGELGSQLNYSINVTQVATLVLSLLRNLLATMVSFLFLPASSTLALANIQVLQMNGRSWAGKIFVLLIETGAFYSVSYLTVLLSSLIPLKGLDGTVGDLYTPVSTQLAGIYPVVVLLLITQDYLTEQSEPLLLG
ncbi:hypothetical protein F5051DRAFT_336331, partial [Lentinula edodes]